MYHDFLFFGRFIPDIDKMLIMEDKVFTGDSLENRCRISNWQPDFSELAGFRDIDGDSLHELYGYWGDSLVFFKLQPALGEMSVRRGWNLVSLPVLPEDVYYRSVFPFVVPPMFWYNPAIHNYETVDLLEIGKGYYAFSTTDTAITLIGEPIDTLPVHIARGWNMLGAFSAITPVSVFESLPGTVPNAYQYNPTTRGYEVKQHIVPGSGFWLLATDSLDTILTKDR